ncbi:hypothetical protein Trydic_g10385 [Trypoxylus dichotomus]
MIRFLVVTFEVARNNGTSTSTNAIKFQNIKDIFLDVQTEIWFSLGTHATLEFLQLLRPHSAEFTDDVCTPLREEVLKPIEANEEECIAEEGAIVTLEHKTNAVTYWGNGKKSLLALNTVLQK